MEDFIERRIIIGAIVSNDFMSKAREIIDPSLFLSDTAKQLIGWCLEHYDAYGNVPERDIEGIFAQKVRDGDVGKDRVEWFDNILSGLSEEYERKSFNADYLYDQCSKYMKERSLRFLSDCIRDEVDSGRLTDAETLVHSFMPTVDEGVGDVVEPFGRESIKHYEEAFKERENPLFKLPKAIGDMMNFELVRSGFISFMGEEKIGKTFFLMELAIRAASAGCNVAMFQAGDMTRNQQLRRFAIRMARKSDQERFCGLIWIPEADCALHQADDCRREQRERSSRLGLQSVKSVWELKYDDLVRLSKDNAGHACCRNCSDMMGVPWLRARQPVNPLTWIEGYRKAREFESRYKAKMKLATYANDTLTIREIFSKLKLWERKYGFVPDVIVIDYADLLAPDGDMYELDYRNRINSIWKRLRRLSEEHRCLVITATQAAASSYDKPLLRRSDFSEDKRKYAHITAMYGLNQTNEEKKIGIMRINELDVRESFFERVRTVKVLQRLQMGRPILTSYW